VLCAKVAPTGGVMCNFLFVRGVSGECRHGPLAIPLLERSNKEVLSSVWTDDVCNFMRSPKGQCIRNKCTPVYSDAIS
jgi:hypothetical protein